MDYYIKTLVLESVYPVGSVYISLTDSRNPNTILGFGTWEALPAGYSIVSQGTATTEDGSSMTFTVGSTSGEFKHKLSNGELPKLSGSFRVYTWDDGSPSGVFTSTRGRQSVEPSGAGTYTTIHFNAGNDEYHNNVSPCIPSYVWKRTK